MIYLFLADGFEECEALAPLDILRRGGIQVKTVGVGKEYITGTHGITVKADILEGQVVLDDKLQGVYSREVCREPIILKETKP